VLHHFFLTLPSGEVRALAAPFLPRVGDSIEIGGVTIKIDKVAWISNGSTIADEPMLRAVSEKVHTDHIVGGPFDVQVLAEGIAHRYPDKLIHAIKELRSQTNLGLKEAKDIMDVTYARLGYR
jgi:ribosomal protein L7/L12